MTAPIRDAYDKRAPTMADYDEPLARFDSPVPAVHYLPDEAQSARSRLMPPGSDPAGEDTGC